MYRTNGHTIKSAKSLKLWLFPNCDLNKNLLESLLECIFLVSQWSGEGPELPHSQGCWGCIFRYALPKDKVSRESQGMLLEKGAEGTSARGEGARLCRIQEMASWRRRQVS